MPNELNREIDKLLTMPTPKQEIKYRQSKFGLNEGDSVQMLAYVDARYVMQKLDDVFGCSNWSNEYVLIGGKTFCKLTATFPDGTVVSKMDVGAETDFEQEKGVVSDALKRTAVLFGIGRDLYSLPKNWADVGRNGFVSQGWRPLHEHTDSDTQAGGGSNSTNHNSIHKATPPATSSIQRKADEVVAKIALTAPTKLPDPSYSPPQAQENVPDVLSIKNVELKATSQKAIMIEQHGSGGNEVWIPNSQIKGKTVNNVGDVGTIDIPGWLADKNGLTSANDDNEVPF